MATARVTRLTVRTGAPTARVTRLRVRTSDTSLWSLAIAGPASTTNITPFEVGDFVAVTGQTPDSWLWDVPTGGPVPLVGANTASVTITAPARPVAWSFTLRATVARAGSPTLTSTVLIKVAPHAGLFRPDGSGVFLQSAGGIAPPPRTPGTYSDTYSDTY